MKEQPNFTIVYVFGPEQCEEKYFKDEILSREAGEWVKIGETGYKGDIETVTDEILRKEALSRIRQESRTGIPVTSVLYDVFIFPPKGISCYRHTIIRSTYILEVIVEGAKC